MYVPFSKFLSVLNVVCPGKVEELACSCLAVEYGCVPVGLKVQYLSRNQKPFTGLIAALGGNIEVLKNRYKNKRASLCLVLPPVGSARAAILFLECLEKYTGIPFFGNPDIQIQVCSPGRLGNRDAGILTLGFLLGSDTLRMYNLGDLSTTFAFDQDVARGIRMVIYDGGGSLVKEFEWWDCCTASYSFKKIKYRIVREQLPFSYERTDVLACSSRVDIENVNLMATLLVHAMMGGYWQDIGLGFAKDMTNLLLRHELAGHLDAPWVHTEDKLDIHKLFHANGLFIDAMQEVGAYALDEAERIRKRGGTGGILYEVSNLLRKYRLEMVRQSYAY